MKAAITIILALLVGFAIGQGLAQRSHAQILQAQWDAEIRRFEYAYEQVDSCASDTCVEAWSELLGHDVEAK